MGTETIALVGAVGGAGTTRLTLECGTALAGDGRDVAVLDAAYGSQGLADRLEGRVDPDMTTVCVDDRPVEAGLIDRPADGAGRLAVCPARAPFERIADAKAPAAAERFATKAAAAARQFDHVLLDTPPVAANQAVAAVDAADRAVLVCDAARAAAGLPRARDRLADIGVGSTAAVVTRTDGHPGADATLPEFDAETPAVSRSAAAHGAVADLLSSVADIDLEPAREGLRDRLPL